MQPAEIVLNIATGLFVAAVVLFGLPLLLVTFAPHHHHVRIHPFLFVVWALGVTPAIALVFLLTGQVYRTLGVVLLAGALLSVPQTKDLAGKSIWIVGKTFELMSSSIK